MKLVPIRKAIDSNGRSTLTSVLQHHFSFPTGCQIIGVLLYIVINLILISILINAVYTCVHHLTCTSTYLIYIYTFKSVTFSSDHGSVDQSLYSIFAFPSSLDKYLKQCGMVCPWTAFRCGINQPLMSNVFVRTATCGVGV